MLTTMWLMPSRVATTCECALQSHRRLVLTQGRTRDREIGAEPAHMGYVGEDGPAAVPQ